MEGCKARRLESWKVGRLESLKVGRLEGWKGSFVSKNKRKNLETAKVSRNGRTCFLLFLDTFGSRNKTCTIQPSRAPKARGEA